MKKKIHRMVKVTAIYSCIAITLITALTFLIFGINSIKNKKANYQSPQNSDRLYHIVVTGNYENSPFMKKVYEGASNLAADYNALVELHLPSSQAEDYTLQQAIDYSSYVNADGVISIVDSTDTTITRLPRTDDTIIPLVTTGQYSPNLDQISYIGINHWELGKMIGEEVNYYLPNGGIIYIMNSASSLSMSNTNLLPSLNKTLADKNNNSIQIRFITSLTESNIYNQEDSIVICLSEDDTIYSAIYFSELYAGKKCTLIGYGNNDTCQLYFDKGVIDDLLTLDPVKIGEIAFIELFEYRNTGYANSYMTADLIATRGKK